MTLVVRKGLWRKHRQQYSFLHPIRNAFGYCHLLDFHVLTSSSAFPILRTVSNRRCDFFSSLKKFPNIDVFTFCPKLLLSCEANESQWIIIPSFVLYNLWRPPEIKETWKQGWGVS